MTVEVSLGIWPDGLPEPTVLFCGRASPEYYRSPLFSRREVFAGPDCADAADASGTVRSLRTPAGEYDIAAVVGRLPAHQRPELVVVKADATRGNFPRNLDRLPCPKVLLVGDTHHFQDPVRALLRYAGMEAFDLIVMDHTRHHAHFFLEAGFERVCWIAALDYALRPRAVPERFEHELTFVGQIGAFHPYRRHVMETVVRAGLPLKTLRATPEQTADIYAASAVTLNCSLNGDLNLRIFEALGSGGFLVTDALPPESGLERLFEPGRHLVTYRTPDELVETIRHYLAHPDEARAIRAAGQAHLLATQHPWVKLRQFYGALYDGRIGPEIAVDDTRLRGLVSRGALSRRAEAYGALQSLHLTARRLTVLVDPADTLAAGANVRDLPRAAAAGWEHLDAPPEDVLITPAPADGVRDERALVLPWPEAAGAAAGLLARLSECPAAGHVVAVGSTWAERAHAVRTLADWGFVPVEPGSVLFRCADRLRLAEAALPHLPADRVRCTLMALVPLLDTPEAAVRAAGLARNIGDTAQEEAFLRRAVALDRGHEGALLALAKRAEADGRFADAWLCVAEVLRRRPPDPASASVLAELERRAGADPRLAEHRAALTPAAVAAGRPRRRVLVVTNLFPPQEFGGYGRKLWEFSAELKRRGHDVRVLAADVPEFAKLGMAGTDDLEPFVERSMELYGVWRDGRAHLLEDPARIAAVVQANDRRILAAVERFGSDVCLAGNVDLMTPHFLAFLPQRGIPLIHCVGNRHPGYVAESTPASPLYRIGPASEWVCRTLAEGGFRYPRSTVLYPGARIDHFYRPFLPAFDRLRIVFASLFVDYKGPHVLANALAQLHRQGVNFTCAFAGDTPDAGLFGRVREFCERQGFGDRVSYPGFLDRCGLAGLFERSNVLVFPSSFEEPFGISQVEAMAAGLTVVSSGTGGSREIVRDGVDGLLFKVNDHENLANRLKSLADDPVAWASLSRAGQERAFVFTVARSVDRIEMTFEELLRLKVLSESD